MFGTTDAQEKALDRWVAPYEVGDKKLISYDEDKDGKKTYYYQNWSSNNAYDYLETPFRSILRKVQEGIETEEQLSKGFVKGISDAFSKSIEPCGTLLKSCFPYTKKRPAIIGWRSRCTCATQSCSGTSEKIKELAR